jgi:hypothetical protein
MELAPINGGTSVPGATELKTMERWFGLLFDRWIGADQERSRQLRRWSSGGGWTFRPVSATPLRGGGYQYSTLMASFVIQ